MRIIADENIPYLRGFAEKYGDVTYLAGTNFSKEAIKDADALIVRTVTHFGEEILKGSNVKLICSATIGYDHIDTAYCEANEIKWTNAPGCNSGSVQQYIVSVLILLSRKYNFKLEDKTIGVVGVGNVGRKVARACELLGMRVLRNDPPRAAVEGDEEFVSIDEIKKRADIITFHTPLTKEGEYKTYHLADSDFFENLSKPAFIINSARGGIVDTEAIKKAIKNNSIQGAVVDCWENEPTIDNKYLELLDIATPHIAGYSADGKSNATRMSLEALTDFFELDGRELKEIKPLDAPSPIIDLNDFANFDNRVYGAILRTYNPMSDYANLLADISKFKQLRNEYPLRREYLAYTVINAKESERKLLESLGFNVED